MLLKIFCLRLLPLVCLGRLKEQRKMKWTVVYICIGYCTMFLVSAVKIFEKEKWGGILYLSLSVVPHGLFYLFSMWLIMQCLWKMWSKRVWKRIYFLSIICTILGIFAENYINPQILQIFFENFK